MNTTIENLIMEPLTLFTDEKGNIHLVDDYGNKFAFMSSGKLVFYKPLNPDAHLSFELNKIDGIAYTPFKVSVMSKGEVFEFEPCAPELPRVPDDGSHTSIRAYIEWALPDIHDKIFWSVLDDRPYIDRTLIGGEGAVPYMSKMDLTAIICMVLEKTSYVDAKGHVTNIKYAKTTFDDIIIGIASEHPRNLFIDAISATPADGRHNIEDFLSRLHIRGMIEDPVKDRTYTSWVSRAIFLGAIERQLGNNIKPIHFVPIIIGHQGDGKTQVCMKLGLNKWHAATAEPLTDEKKFYEKVEGATIVELNEGIQFAKGGEEIFKAFMDHSFFRFRRSYGKDTENIPVKFLMIATANNESILNDVTGNRRFYPVYSDVDKTLKLVQSLTSVEMLGYWADALARYYKGERWDDGIQDIRGVAEEVQKDATSDIPGFEEIKQFLDDKYSEMGARVPYMLIRDHLTSETTLSSVEIENAVKLFSKGAENTFGFRRGSKTVRVKINGVSKVVRVYERIRPVQAFEKTPLQKLEESGLIDGDTVPPTMFTQAELDTLIELGRVYEKSIGVWTVIDF